MIGELGHQKEREDRIVGLPEVRPRRGPRRGFRGCGVAACYESTTEQAKGVSDPAEAFV